MSSSIQGVAPATPDPQQQSSIQGEGWAPGTDGKEKLNELFSRAMRNKWQKVAAIYASSKEVRVAKITRAGDTVLHVAVSSHDEANVMLLMDSLDKDDNQTREILEMKNESEDTPLHLAAALGMERVCLAMAKLIPDLVEARNKRKETPLFKAVRHGKRNAFFALQSVVESRIGPPPPPSALSDKHRHVDFCRSKGGDTILHSAIFGEHFDLAFEIIKLYPELVNMFTEKKESPLHVLANMPLVFKSGIHFNLLDSIIYCTFVDPLEEKYPKYKEKIKEKKLTDFVKVRQNVREKLPESYHACYDCFTLLKHAFKTIVPSVRSFFNEKKESSTAAKDDPDEDDEVVVLYSFNKDRTPTASKDGGKADQRNSGSQDKRRFPKISDTFSSFFKLAMKGLLIIVGIAMWRMQKIKKKKRQNTHACQILKELVGLCKQWVYDNDGKRPEKIGGPPFSLDRPPDVEEDGARKTGPDLDGQKHGVSKKLEAYLDKQLEDDSKSKIQPVGVTSILVAAKRGASEVVENLLEKIPMVASDVDGEGKNFVLLAVEHRHSRIYELALKRKEMNHIAAVDYDGNSALHLAAKLSSGQPSAVPGAALRMQWEVKWYKYVAESVGPRFFELYNNKDETARHIFIKEHRELTKEAHKWLTKTSQSCSVVAALIATVAFTTATTLPGGVNQESGFPILEGHPAFKIFAISALAALCFSVMALVTFLSFVTSRYDVWAFDVELPLKLIVNLTSLFLSIAAMLVSFCASHFFVMEKQLKNATYVYPIYAAVCLPVSFFAMTQFPLYVDLIKATFARVPQSAHEF